ncbi:MAG: DNA alkylation repair enzyme [uncultured Sulfurovum sp.]|uniref:DNA alkylation repair enzyme n=1 Tax=uncultured Sulfurovum sp. TaxID=269237 RepID=A0A6S6U9M0_9BACT|nr:MAG: DNA alkylation repair enzyme [uncultured Sulfurovum sp.]
MAEKYSMKDDLYNLEKVTKLAAEIKVVYVDFNQEVFVQSTVEKFPDLELKERMFHIRDRLVEHLPSDYEEALGIIIKALPPELDASKKDDDFGDFIYAPYGEFVTAYGCSEVYLDISLKALREITKRFSVEFAIRDFINTFPKETYLMLEACSNSSHYHERRLASEGLRLKLPWAKKIDIDYRNNIALLDNLYMDDTRFVVRSVANHLNDISKIDLPLVLETLKRWKDSGKQHEKEITFLINHALRTSIKNGDEETLNFLGYRSNPHIFVEHFTLKSDKINIGEAVEFTFQVDASKHEKLILDYIVYFRTKKGTLNPKVHKLKKLVIGMDESVVLSKKHLFKANMSTRTFYEGEHSIALQINGKIYETRTFNLTI